VASSARRGRAERYWAHALSEWANPPAILEAAPESPWGWPASRLRRAPDQIDTPSRHRALEALPAGGVVLDVGVGAGWGSLPLAPPATLVVGVDQDPEMLEGFGAEAEAKGVPHRAVQGRWPDVAPLVEAADVVVSHHVLYNVPDLVPFLAALTDHARRRVVVEVTVTHPAGWLNDLWRRFHGFVRPSRPTVADVAAVLEEMGIGAQMETWWRTPWTRAASRQEVVAFARRRLCLPPERDPEVDALLEEEPGEREFATLWWDAGG
jgi:SAM-dependent methyltransferase